MELKSALKKLRESKEFKEWNSKNKDTFFSYAFALLDNKNNSWQLGFYHKSTDKIKNFIVNENNIEMQKEEDIFKKPGIEVKQIDIEEVKLPFKKILKITEEFQKKKYSNELINKTIAILQNLEEYGNIWNITYITHSFSTLNIKVNAENGKILYHSIDSIMSFVKK